MACSVRGLVCVLVDADLDLRIVQLGLSCQWTLSVFPEPLCTGKLCHTVMGQMSVFCNF